MLTKEKLPLKASLARGAVAGVAATGVMTVFQKFVEMPLTGRETSYAPANLAEKVLRISPTSAQGRSRLNWATHFALGTMWGSAYVAAARKGFRGPKAILTVFAAVYTGDVLLNTALGLYKPGTWTSQDWTVDIVDKFVQAAATGVLYDHVFGPRAE